MLKVYKDDKQYPRKVVDEEGELHFCALDDDMIGIECSFNRMKKHMNDDVSINVRYDIKTEEISFVELKSILYLFVEIRNCQISIIASVDLVDKVRDERWGLNDFVNELNRQLKYYKDIKINYCELGEDAFIWLEKRLPSRYNLEKSVAGFTKEINELLQSTKMGLGKNFLEERHLTCEKVFCEEILTPLFRCLWRSAFFG